MSTDAASTSQITESERLDLEKRRLECEKLRVEIEQASYPWWTRAGYIGSLTPIVIAIGGLLTAFATGYFDTERKNLKNEIHGLTVKRNELEAANNEIQKKIDDTYLKLKIASSEARYALGHISGISVPDPLVNEIVKIAEKDLAELEKNLREIPASKWVTELKPTLRGMYLPDKALLEAPDGRFYDPYERRYYSKDEFSKRKAGE